jgi:hypothetical protein
MPSRMSLEDTLYHLEDRRSARDDAFADREAERVHEPSAVDAADRLTAARGRDAT